MPEMSEESKRKFAGCDTPKNIIQDECKDLPESVQALRVGRDGHRVVMDVGGRIIHLNKDGALTLGQLLIDNALKL